MIWTGPKVGWEMRGEGWNAWREAPKQTVGLMEICVSAGSHFAFAPSGSSVTIALLILILLLLIIILKT